jgi:hypothetical protein
MFYNSIGVGFLDAQIVREFCFGGGTEGVVIVSTFLKDIPYFLFLFVLFRKD